MFDKLTVYVAVLAIGLVAFTSAANAADARPILDTYMINVNGDPDGFVAQVEKVFAKADAMGIKSERGVYVSEIGGTNTNAVYVLIEHENLGAMEAANAKVFATEEWAAFMAATKKMGQASMGREVIRELYRK
jgi:hypothetical protein